MNEASLHFKARQVIESSSHAAVAANILIIAIFSDHHELSTTKKDSPHVANVFFFVHQT